MTKLSEYLPLEAVRQNKKLQEIKCENYWFYQGEDMNGVEYLLMKLLVNDKMSEKDYPAPTIADIIDNAESLFKMPIDIIVAIICLCRADDSIEEISDYIIKNIKD